jgi:ribosome-binding ATPase
MQSLANIPVHAEKFQLASEGLIPYKYIPPTEHCSDRERHNNWPREYDMKVGIVGFPGCGKTTIFNALTGLQAQTGFGGKTKENMGSIKVPDPRVDRLAELHASKKKVYAEITFVDVGARPEQTSNKSGIDSQVLAAMRECDALVLVLRGFANPSLSEIPNPGKDMTSFISEMILSDMAPLENRSERLKKEFGKEKEKELVQRCITHLEAERPLSSLSISPEEQRTLAGFGLLTLKPLLVLLNQEEGDLAGGIPADLAAQAAKAGLDLMGISGKIEQDIGALAPEEQPEFLNALGLTASARDRFIRQAYAKLDLISFLTTGPDESRAWPIKRGTTAQKAAGRIHSDIERGFIRAEVIPCGELITLGSEKKARDAGKLRLEGKDYTVQDGDVIEFRFNV